MTKPDLTKYDGWTALDFAAATLESQLRVEAVQLGLAPHLVYGVDGPTAAAAGRALAELAKARDAGNKPIATVTLDLVNAKAAVDAEKAAAGK